MTWAGDNLLGNGGFEGWQNTTSLYYWGGIAAGGTINQAGSGIYLAERGFEFDAGGGFVLAGRFEHTNRRRCDGGVGRELRVHSGGCDEGIHADDASGIEFNVE